jgi:outer membrane protein OmpA-like peptidoglycan-associated protein
MDYADTVDYVNFRMERAGCTRRSPFTGRAMETIWKASGGIPRLINQLGERALNEAQYRGKERVGGREVKRVVNDPLYQPLFVSKAKSCSMKAAFASTALALCVGVSLGLWYVGIGGKLLPEKDTGVQHVPVENRTLIKKPIAMPSLADKGGSEPTNAGATVEEATLSALVSGEVTEVQQEFQTPRTTHAAAIFGPLGEQPGSSMQMLATHDQPDLRLSAIAWDEDPARCIAVVNDRIVHEGEFLGELRVLRIKPDHIVLNYGNEHIIKGIHTREEEQNLESDDVQVSSEEHSNEVGDSSNQNYIGQSLTLRNYRSIVNFSYAASRLSPEAHEELDRVVSLAKQIPNGNIVILGYTDSVGSYEYNKRLSESRARMVEGYLVENEIDPERITTAGMGEKNPLMPNTSLEGRAANRRVEIELVPDEDYSDSVLGG